jgi:AcrR family transcriptional regulator
MLCKAFEELELVKQSARSVATVDLVIQQAAELFSAKGFDATSVDDVAQAAGLTKGAVYHHFESKAELFTHVLTSVQSELAVTLASGTSVDAAPVDLISASVYRYLLHSTSPERCRILFIDGPAVIGWSAWREIDKQFFSAGLQARVEAIFDGNAPPRRVAAVTHLLMGAITEAALVCSSVKNRKQMAREFASAISGMLRGLRRE